MSHRHLLTVKHGETMERTDACLQEVDERLPRHVPQHCLGSRIWVSDLHQYDLLVESWVRGKSWHNHPVCCGSEPGRTQGASSQALYESVSLLRRREVRTVFIYLWCFHGSFSLIKSWFAGVLILRYFGLSTAQRLLLSRWRRLH